MTYEFSPPWRKFFDHIYCFSFISNKARRDSLKVELDRVGILNSGIFSFVYTSSDKWESRIEAVVPRISPENKSNCGFINLGLATARTLREALGLGYKRVLFLEDDIRFLNCKEWLYRSVAYSPWDYNIIQYDKFVDWCMTADEYRYMTLRNRIDGTPFFDGHDSFFPSGACFAADEVGMKAMLRFLEDVGPRPVDGIFGMIDVKRAVASNNLAVQVLFSDALVMDYIGENSHHRGYKPQGLEYANFNVPQGYGYDSLCARLD